MELAVNGVVVLLEERRERRARASTTWEIDRGNRYAAWRGYYTHLRDREPQLARVYPLKRR